MTPPVLDPPLLAEQAVAASKPLLPDGFTGPAAPGVSGAVFSLRPDVALAPLSGFAPAVPDLGTEGVTVLPDTGAPLPGLAPAVPDLDMKGFTAAPPLGLTLPGFGAVDPISAVYNATAKGDPPVSGAIPGRSTKGNTEQWQVPGGNVSQLKRDFEARNVDLNPKQIRGPDGEKGLVGKTTDGRTITSRDWSTDGRPTLQIFGPGSKNIEVRYGSEFSGK